MVFPGAVCSAGGKLAALFYYMCCISFLYGFVPVSLPALVSEQSFQPLGSSAKGSGTGFCLKVLRILCETHSPSACVFLCWSNQGCWLERSFCFTLFCVLLTEIPVQILQQLNTSVLSALTDTWVWPLFSAAAPLTQRACFCLLEALPSSLWAAGRAPCTTGPPQTHPASERNITW